MESNMKGTTLHFASGALLVLRRRERKANFVKRVQKLLKLDDMVRNQGLRGFEIDSLMIIHGFESG